MLVILPYNCHMHWRFSGQHEFQEYHLNGPFKQKKKTYVVNVIHMTDQNDFIWPVLCLGQT